MKLINFFLSYYYNVEVKNSETQLGQDFGYFPPIPLDCAPLKKEFTIVRVRSIGIFYFQWKVSEKIIKSLKNDPSSISREFIQLCGNENFYLLRQGLQNLHRYSKFLAKIVILFMALKMARMTIASIIKKSNGVGVFTPLMADESNIVILTSRLKGRSDESIVSHEHIHFLQHRNPEVHNRYVKSPKKLLSDKYSQISYCLYQLEKKK